MERDIPEELLSRTRRAAGKAVRAGQFAPTFRLPDVRGGHRALIDLIERGPLVLSFHRGVWCDFCGAALEALARHDGMIRSLGATQAAIGPPPGDDAERARLRSFPMPQLIDPRLRVTSAYGLTLSLPQDLHEPYARMGYAPTGISRTGEWDIAIPATYIIDRSGYVAISMIDMDYRERISPDHLSSALRGLQRRRRPPTFPP